MRIRTIQESDLTVLEELERRCFSDPWGRESLRLLLQEPVLSYCLLDDAGEILAYGGMYCVLDEGQILNLATRPEARRKGCAGQILERFFSDARERGLSLLTLEVRAGNTAAVSLYEKFGFRRVGIRPNYYVHPKEDAWLMNLELSGQADTYADFGI